ncbi:N-acetylglucosamine kinase [Salimicrobium halophilum]|uniref:BadF-type ATPase n=1 Tax=Salimicrobium halophilum TaxID=86666 RepID=A0A1G8T414_9BACI|nr:BadF/BadG/BcrA/BcrD ATPase family protein [Salimicrobium halophilum]SDJ35430.1 BadF-type ATPase [Salimicrobium halophilum]
MEYIIGIDGGGSETEVAFFPEEDLHNPVQVNYGSGSNPRSVGYDQSASVIASIVEKGMKQQRIAPESIVGVGAGIAGAGRAQEQEELMGRLKSLFLDLNISENSNIKVSSDSEVALLGALPPGTRSGMLIISGTGSNAVGIDEEIFCKSGGWGHLFGDEGSGYDIGEKVLRRVAKEKDGRSPSSELTEIVLKEVGLEHAEDLIDHYYRAEDQKREIAALAKPVLEHENLSVVQGILEDIVTELVLHIRSLHNKMTTRGRDVPIFTAGAIFEHSAFVKEIFRKRVESENLGWLMQAYSSPASGAAKLVERRGV